MIFYRHHKKINLLNKYRFTITQIKGILHFYCLILEKVYNFVEMNNKSNFSVILDLFFKRLDFQVSSSLIPILPIIWR